MKAESLSLKEDKGEKEDQSGQVDQRAGEQCRKVKRGVKSDEAKESRSVQT